MISSNREEFLTQLARKFGRELQKTPAPVPARKVDYPALRLTDMTREQLLEDYISYSRSIGITVDVCKEDQVADVLVKCIDSLGGGPVIFNNDQRIHQTGGIEATKAKYQTMVWDKTKGQANIDFAAEANVGVVFAENGSTESGGIFLESGPEYGRSVSLLPKYSVVMLYSSTVIERVHQYAVRRDAKVKAGERTPSLINLISGPSSTADIELVAVIGVHGPIHVTYIIIDDEGSCGDHKTQAEDYAANPPPPKVAPVFVDHPPAMYNWKPETVEADNSRKEATTDDKATIDTATDK